MGARGRLWGGGGSSKLSAVAAAATPVRCPPISPDAPPSPLPSPSDEMSKTQKNKATEGHLGACLRPPPGLKPLFPACTSNFLRGGRSLGCPVAYFFYCVVRRWCGLGGRLSSQLPLAMWQASGRPSLFGGWKHSKSIAPIDSPPPADPLRGEGVTQSMWLQASLPLQASGLPIDCLANPLSNATPRRSSSP